MSKEIVKGTNKVERDDPLHPNEVAADIQDVQSSKQNRRNKPRSVVNMAPFNAVNESQRFSIPGNNFQGKVYKRMCGAWAREVITVNTTSGEERLGDWVACGGSDFVGIITPGS